MQLPSIQYLIAQATGSFKRFYLPLIFATIGTIAAILLVEEKWAHYNIYINKTFFTCIIGLPFSLGCCLYCERMSNERFKFAVLIISVLLIILYGITLAPTDIDTINVKLRIIFFILFLVAHLWVSFAAYVQSNEQIGFWRLNEAFFTRIIISGIYSSVLYGGLCLALVALDKLLNFDIGGKVYVDLWCIIAGLFNTWFFLSGIPDKYEPLNTLDKFPNWLKVFTQYILLPLVTLYLLILYTYSLNIILQGHLPNGWVSVLIISYAIAGILALLLVNPIRNDTNNTWVKVFSRFFYIALLPLVVLLFVAIGVRVKHYGITEDRYFLIVLGLWLLGMALYFIFSKTKNIRVIPISLALIGTLTLIGPWSAFNISANSQTHRLENIFKKNNIAPTQINSPMKNIDSMDYTQINEILHYVVLHEDLNYIQKFYKSIDVQKIANNIYKADTNYNTRQYRYSDWSDRNKIKDTLLGLLHIASSKSENLITNYNFSSKENLLDIAGYKKAINYYYRTYNNEDSIQTFSFNNSRYTVSFNSTKKLLEFKDNDNVVGGANIGLLALKLKSLRIENYTKVPLDTITISIANNKLSAKVYFKSIDFIYVQSKEKREIEITSFDAWILLK